MHLLGPLDLAGAAGRDCDLALGTDFALEDADGRTTLLRYPLVVGEQARVEALAGLLAPLGSQALLPMAGGSM